MYNMLHDNPQEYYDKRKLRYSKELHDLIVGMTLPNPQCRFTID
jgi:hypothetical protein